MILEITFQVSICSVKAQKHPVIEFVLLLSLLYLHQFFYIVNMPLSQSSYAHLVIGIFSCK